MVCLREGVEIVDVEEGRVLLDTRKGVYWHLNDAAVAFLEALAAGRGVDEHVRAVASATGVDEQRVRSDHQGLLREFRRARLVTDGPS